MGAVCASKRLAHSCLTALACQWITVNRLRKRQPPVSPPHRGSACRAHGRGQPSSSSETRPERRGQCSARARSIRALLLLLSTGSRTYEGLPDTRKEEMLRLEREDVGHRAKSLLDYTYLLKHCLATETALVLMLEDDVVAADDWYHRTAQALRTLEESCYLGAALYLRLFYATHLLGWNAEGWHAYLLWSLVVTATVPLHCSRCGSATSVPPATDSAYGGDCHPQTRSLMHPPFLRRLSVDYCTTQARPAADGPFRLLFASSGIPKGSNSTENESLGLRTC